MERKRNQKYLKAVLSFVLAIALVLGFVPVSTVPDVAQAETVVAVVQDWETLRIVNEYTSLQEAVDCAIDNSGKYIVILEADVTLDTALTIQTPENSARASVDLDLNGHTIDRGLSDKDAVENGYVIEVIHAGFSVQDSSDDKKGTITGGNNIVSGGGMYIKNGNVSICDVTIKGNRAQNGAGVYVDNGENPSNLALSGTSFGNKSSITGNFASEKGGGVYVCRNNTVYLHDIDITSNSAGSDGGGVYADEGSSILVAGCPCVRDNKKGNGAGSNVNAVASVIQLQNASYGGLDKKARIGVSILDSEDQKVFTSNHLLSEWTPANFFSDDPEYVIGYNEGGFKDYYYEGPNAFLCKKENAHTVTFVDGGETWKEEKVAHNSIVSEPELPDGRGGVFEGWYEGDTEFDFSGTRITTGCSLTARWNEGTATPYLDSGSLKTINAVPLTGTETNLKPGWYVVNRDINFATGATLTLTGDVNLILADDVTMNVGAISGYANLTVYGQEKGNGKLCPSGVIELNDKFGTGNFTLHGGEVNISSRTVFERNVRITGGKLGGSFDGEASTFLTIVFDFIIDGGIVDLTRKGNADDKGYAVEASDIIINGGDVTLTYTEDIDTQKGKRFAIFSRGDVKINGGRVIVKAELKNAEPVRDDDVYAAIVSNHSISIGCRSMNDSFMATCSDDGSLLPACVASAQFDVSWETGVVQIAEGQTLMDKEESTKTYTGTLTADQIKAITGRTLVKWKSSGSSGGSSGGGYSGGGYSGGGGSGGGAPAASPAPTASATPTASAAPVASAAPTPVASTTPGSAPTIVDQKTETTTSPDGTTTTTTTTLDSEGTKKVEAETVKTDGSVEKVTDVAKTDGSTEKVVETTHPDGSSEKVIDTKNADGTTEKSTETVKPSGASEKVTDIEKADGTTIHEEVSTTAKGKETSTVVEVSPEGDRSVTESVTKPNGDYEKTTSETVVKKDDDGNVVGETTTIRTEEKAGKTTQTATFKVVDPEKHVIKLTQATTTAKNGVVTIPKTVKSDGTTYKVTTLVKGMLKGSTTKPKTVDLQAGSIKTVQKGAFNNLAKNGTITITGNKKQFKKLKKLIIKSGLPKGVKIERA